MRIHFAFLPLLFAASTLAGTGKFFKIICWLDKFRFYASFSIFQLILVPQHQKVVNVNQSVELLSVTNFIKIGAKQATNVDKKVLCMVIGTTVSTKMIIGNWKDSNIIRISKISKPGGSLWIWVDINEPGWVLVGLGGS